MKTPIAGFFRRRTHEAAWFRVKSIPATAWRIFALVCADTVQDLSGDGFKARDTTETEYPSSLAISLMFMVICLVKE